MNRICLYDRYAPYRCAMFARAFSGDEAVEHLTLAGSYNLAYFAIQSEHGN